MTTEPKTPWLKYYGEVSFHQEYPDCTMFEMVEEVAQKYPDYLAYEFLCKTTTYKEFVAQIRRAARALSALGIKEDERVTICMPNTPQAVITFYALNLIGAIGNMIHPLSSEGEIRFYLEESQSVAVLTLDQFYPKFVEISKEYAVPKLIITSIGDALPPIKRLGYKLTLGRKIAKVPETDKNVIMWNDLMKLGDSYNQNYEVKRKATDAAVILYSGGTSGKTKGILLSNRNFNALSVQTIAMDTHFKPGDRVLSVMPIFHGFGLGISIHTFLTQGGECILVPRFNAQTYAELLRKQQPNYIAGVPTLYEALLRNPDMNDVDLSCLKGVFSGGDSLSIELKKKFDKFLTEHKANVVIREGYGTTECVTASCLTPYTTSREGSIGLPFPDTYYQICAVNTTDEVPYGEEGEICLSGPTVMMEYVNHPEETAKTLQRHPDGRIWLHTGDLGIMDADGFIYFRQRIKRMIVSSGYNIYPSQLENIFDAHDKVLMSCIIGVPDDYKMQKVKAFIQLKPEIAPSDEVKEELLAYARKNIAKYAMPYDIEFREELPRTLVGKVAFRVLEKEEADRRTAAAQAKAQEQELTEVMIPEAEESGATAIG